MTSARRTTDGITNISGITRHRRIRGARKPAIGALAAAGVFAGAWYATAGAATTAAPNLVPTTTTAVTLAAKFPYLSAGYNNTREWTRTSTAVAPNGTLRVAWPAADGVHVTPLTAAGKRSGADTVVKGTKEVGGLVAHNDGFALLTRVADTNKWKDTAAAIVRYTGGKQTFRTKLTAPRRTTPLPYSTANSPGTAPSTGPTSSCTARVASPTATTATS